MKKTMTMIALAALFVSCAKEAGQTPTTSGDVITVAPTEFHATLDTPEPDTKTTLGTNGKTVLWEKGDSISVWPNTFNQAKYTLSSGAGTTSATFTLSSEPATGDAIGGNFALYPYDGEVVLTIEGEFGVFKNIKYPAVQNYRENSWDKGAMTMLAMGPLSDNSLAFVNFAGVLRLTLIGTAKIDSIRVSALDADEYIAGVFDYNFVKGGTVFTSGKKTVTLNCGESGVTLSKTEGTVFNIVIPPITGGFKVAICDRNHEVMILQSSSEIKRNTILNMPAKEYAPNAKDLGLSVYWATCNVGATIPEGYGDYFAWGETDTYYESGHAYDNPCANWKDGKSSGYEWASYTKLSEGSSDTLTKYNDTDDKTVLEADDDVASAKWGAAWRMPTVDEFEELCWKCTWPLTTINEVNGCKFTSKVEGYTDISIFLPAAGYRTGDSLSDVGSFGSYWSSSLNRDYYTYAEPLRFDGRVVVGGDVLRSYGYSVRPVSAK